MKRFSAVLLVFALLVSAAGCETETPVPGERDSKSVASLIPYLESADAVSASAGITSYRFFGGRVHAPANDEQAETIVNLLSDIDMSLFEELGEDSQYGGVTVEFLIESKDELCFVALMRQAAGSMDINGKSSPDEDAEYIKFEFISRSEYEIYYLHEDIEEIKNSFETRIFMGAYSAVPDFIQLGEAQRQVLADFGGDEVTVLSEPDRSYSVNKGAAAMVKSIFDGIAATTEEYGGDYNFDVRVSLSGTVYLLDTATGAFSFEGESAVFELDSWVNECLFRLGLST